MSDVDRLTEIADEVMVLIGHCYIFGSPDERPSDLWKVDLRLQEVMKGRQSFETIELAMYLRASSWHEANLPTWQPLLNAAIEIGKMRGDPIDDIFYGLMEPRSEPAKNTGYPV